MTIDVVQSIYFYHSLKRTTMLVLAVTLHNIPEGMAVGVAAGGDCCDFYICKKNSKWDTRHKGGSLC